MPYLSLPWLRLTICMKAFCLLATREAMMMQQPFCWMPGGNDQRLGSLLHASMMEDE